MIRRADELPFRERLAESDRFHMGIGKVHQTLRALADDLTRERIDYVIVGGMALNAHGYARETVDVDVRLTPTSLDSFRRHLVGRGYIEKFAGARKSFRNTDTGVTIEFLTTGEYPGDGKTKPVAFPDPAAVATDVDGIKFASLPALIELKLASGMTQPARRRDLADVQDLIRIRHLDAAYADQLNPYVREMYLTLLNELSAPDPNDESRGQQF